MASLNLVQVIGNLGQDAELKYTQSGKAVVTFSLATNEKWKDKTTGASKEKVEWHRVVIWDKLAETLATFLVKGKPVYVQGSLQSRKWTDKEGVERTLTEILGRVVLLLGSQPKTNQAPHPSDAVTDEDVPF